MSARSKQNVVSRTARVKARQAIELNQARFAARERARRTTSSTKGKSK